MVSPIASILIVLIGLTASPLQAAKAKPRTKAKPAEPAVQLEPAIEPYAARYDADLAALRTARQAELEQRRTAYLAALDGAIAKVAGGADAALIGVLRKDREGVARGLVTPANPVGLPPEIQTARKLFFNRVEFSAMTFATEKKKLDDAYLKLLATLARQTRSDKVLAVRIAAEKRRVTSGL